MLFNLLLAKIAILLCAFLFFTISVVIENAKLKLTLSIPTDAQITVAIDAVEMLPIAADKTIKDLTQK